MMRATTTAAALAAALVLTGCGGSGDADAPALPDRVQGGWVLVDAAMDGVALALREDHPITLTVDDMQLGGTAACNSYFGTFAVDGTHVSITGLGQTEMACTPSAIMDLEHDYLAALASVEELFFKEELLTLTGPTADLRYERSQR